jgi:hypothetical protein
MDKNVVKRQHLPTQLSMYANRFFILFVLLSSLDPEHPIWTIPEYTTSKKTLADCVEFRNKIGRDAVIEALKIIGNAKTLKSINCMNMQKLTVLKRSFKLLWKL